MTEVTLGVIYEDRNNSGCLGVNPSLILQQCKYANTVYTQLSCERKKRVCVHNQDSGGWRIHFKYGRAWGKIAYMYVHNLQMTRHHFTVMSTLFEFHVHLACLPWGKRVISICRYDIVGTTNWICIAAYHRTHR